jgi:hypothetical protein
MTSYLKYVSSFYNKSISSINDTITLASAQEVPAIGTPLERLETADLMVENFNGGLSFSIAEAFRNSVKQSNPVDSNQHLVVLIERLAIFGTCDTRVDVSQSKLTNESKILFYELVESNVDLVVQTIRGIYLDARAPKITHLIYLISLLTSISTVNAGNSEPRKALIRSKGYGLVSMFKIPTHLLDWINTHITLSSTDNHQLFDTTTTVPVKQRHVVQKKTKPVRIIRAGGTGAGFRAAVESWYLDQCAQPENAIKLARAVTKYCARFGYSHKDVLSLVHPKTTTLKKCKCQSKKNCSCRINQHSYETTNLVSVAGQVVLSYAVHGLEHAGKSLDDGVQRYRFHNKSEPSIDSDIHYAYRVFAFLSAVDRAKNPETTTEELLNLIRFYDLTREMVSNTKLADINVLFALTVKQSKCSQVELCESQVSLLLASTLSNHDLIKLLFVVDPSSQVSLPKTSDDSIGEGLRIGMPITALVRNLNRLTIGQLFDRDHNPRADELLSAVSNQLTNQEVLTKGMVHPINLFNAWATYSKGCGYLGSQSWTPIEQINSALLNGVEMAFKGLNGYNFPIAFFLDASGSMSSRGSAAGMPCLTALDIGVLMLLTLYRATANCAEKSNQPMPNHMIGYFGGNGTGGFGWSNDQRSVNKIVSDEELEKRSCHFKEVTHEFSPSINFKDAKKALGDGSHMGMTDVGSAIWYLIKKLKMSLEQYVAGNPMYKSCTLFQLHGFVELMIMITDNDVNSGDQPMDVLKLYRGLIKRGFELIPYDRDGKPSDPQMLFDTFQPRLVVIATQGGSHTVGDPRDSHILNVVGFDSASPMLIDAFVNKAKKHENVMIDEED